MLGLLLGCTAIVCVGIWDDICNIPAKVKLVGQILSAAIPVVLHDIPNGATVVGIPGKIVKIKNTSSKVINLNERLAAEGSMYFI